MRPTKRALILAALILAGSPFYLTLYIRALGFVLYGRTWTFEQALITCSVSMVFAFVTLAYADIV